MGVVTTAAVKGGIELGVLPAALGVPIVTLTMAPLTDLLMPNEAGVDDQPLLDDYHYENYTKPKLDQYLEDRCKELVDMIPYYKRFHIDYSDLLESCQKCEE